MSIRQQLEQALVQYGAQFDELEQTLAGLEGNETVAPQVQRIKELLAADTRALTRRIAAIQERGTDIAGIVKLAAIETSTVEGVTVKLLRRAEGNSRLSTKKYKGVTVTNVRKTYESITTRGWVGTVELEGKTWAVRASFYSWMGDGADKSRWLPELAEWTNEGALR